MPGAARLQVYCEHRRELFNKRTQILRALLTPVGEMLRQRFVSIGKPSVQIGHRLPGARLRFENGQKLNGDKRVPATVGRINT